MSKLWSSKNLDSNKNHGLRKEESQLEKNIKEEKEKVISNAFIEQESKNNKISYKDNKLFQFVKKYIFGYGRISRSHYLKIILSASIFINLLLLFDTEIQEIYGFIFLSLLIPFFLMLFLFPINRLRFHDSNRSGGKYLIYLIIIIVCSKFYTGEGYMIMSDQDLWGKSEMIYNYPQIIISLLVFYVVVSLFSILFRKGDVTKNKYGDNPNDKYIGDYKNGQKNGIGIYTFANGERYEGEFKDDMFHGNGTYYFADGTKEEGVFEYDELMK
jgi:uncharacterized membrane protein YhaH (DUF805 family)